MPLRMHPLAASAANAVPVAWRKRRRWASMGNPLERPPTRDLARELDPIDRPMSALSAVAHVEALWSTAAKPEGRLDADGVHGAAGCGAGAGGHHPGGGAAGRACRTRRPDPGIPGRTRNADACADDARREAHPAQGLLRHRLRPGALRGTR